MIFLKNKLQVTEYTKILECCYGTEKSLKYPRH